MQQMIFDKTEVWFILSKGALRERDSNAYS